MTTQLAPADSALVLSPWMSVEHLDETAATIYLSSDGTRIRIPLSLHRLLLRFKTATDPDEVGGSDPQAAAARAIAQLRAKGFLVAANALPTVPTRKVSDPPVRLFDVPAQKLAPSQADVVVLGMPWDFGDRDAAGARRGPLAIREVSLQMLYGLDRQTGRPLGWFDADRRCPILAGIAIADAGDVIVHHGESRSSFFERAGDVLATLCADGALPVLLGGDASVAYPVIEQRQRGEAIDVIRIGRLHTGPLATALTAASLPAHVLGLPSVGRYIQIVPKAIDGVGTNVPAGYVCLPIDDALAAERNPLAGPADEGRRVHLGIDIDALALAHDDARPASFVYRDVHALLHRIGRHYRIASIDLCGINPSGACWGPVSMTALHLLLTALSAAKDPA